MKNREKTAAPPSRVTSRVSPPGTQAGGTGPSRPISYNSPRTRRSYPSSFLSSNTSKQPSPSTRDLGCQASAIHPARGESIYHLLPTYFEAHITEKQQPHQLLRVSSFSGTPPHPQIRIFLYQLLSSKCLSSPREHSHPLAHTTNQV